MAETTDIAVETDTDAPSEYTTESASSTDVAARAVNIAPAGATGRRKEAVARVRITPGTGSWTVNGHPLEQYFPNKLHQQLVNEPFVLTGLVGSYDVIARIHGGGTSGQAATVDAGEDVVLADQARQHERLVDELLVQLVGEVRLQRSAVDGPLPGPRDDADPGDGFLAATGRGRRCDRD